MPELADIFGKIWCQSQVTELADIFEHIQLTWLRVRTLFSLARENWKIKELQNWVLGPDSMPRCSRFCPSNIPVHVIQRGNNRQTLFNSDKDIAAYAHWLKEGALKFDAIDDPLATVLEAITSLSVLATQKGPAYTSRDAMVIRCIFNWDLTVSGFRHIGSLMWKQVSQNGKWCGIL